MYIAVFRAVRLFKAFFCKFVNVKMLVNYDKKCVSALNEQDYK